MSDDLQILPDDELIVRIPAGPLRDELRKRLADVSHFKRVAAYLGECHAANLSEAQLSTCSNSRRERFKSIMLKAARMLRKEEKPGSPAFAPNPTREVQEAIERLEDHAAKITLK